MGKDSNHFREKFRKKFPSKKRKKKKSFHFSAILPNITTALALCTGLSSVRFALLGQWELAIICIFASAIMDTMDGRLARYLGSTSRFGAELDSLSDFICFGVSPTLIIYLKSLHEWKGLGWIIALYFSVCMALRLARFNTISIEGNPNHWSDNYFMGIPAPPAAILTLTPLMIDLSFVHHGIHLTFTSPYTMTIIMILIGSICISKTPTFSHKQIKIPREYVHYVLIATALFAGALFIEPWTTLSILSLFYIFTIPISFLKFKREQKILLKNNVSFYQEIK